MARKAIAKYYGAKFYLVPILLKLIPPHSIYVEVFGGMGNLLLAKKPSSKEIFNDINSLIINFFKVLIHDKRRERLLKKLKYTPFSREIFYEAIRKYEESDYNGPVDKAWVWFVGVSQAFGGMAFSSWMVGKTIENDLVKYWNNSVKRLPRFVARLKSVVFENYSYEKMFELYDSKDTWLFLDPPYIGEQRTQMKRYEHEMDEAAHANLLTYAKNAEGMVLLSGYDNPLYEEELSEWHRIDVKAVNWITNPKVQGHEKKSRIETLWFNYNFIKRKLDEFSDKLTFIR